MSLAQVGERFGRKAAGFITIPTAWRPRALFLEVTLYERWAVSRSFTAEDRQVLLAALGTAREHIGESIILRSSATNETVQERGRFKSDRVDLKDVAAVLDTIETIFRSYPSDETGRMCLLVQEFVPAHVTGYLSNEVRLVDKPYRWVLEQKVDSPSGPTLHSDTISAKQARDYPSAETLICLSPSELRSRLSSVARHFWKEAKHRNLVEWCWDGQRLWLLQRDDASAPSGGYLPTDLKQRPALSWDFRNGKTFKVFEVGTTTPWKKLRNVLDFAVDGEIPPHRLYYALATKVREAIARDEVGLSTEIERLTGGRAVIRSDTVTSAFNLPRSDTLTGAQAVIWLKERLQEWSAGDQSLTNFAFIMHSYIPARAAAWSYYRRGEPTVFIDGLWGLVDGIQYYPCDTYIASVDGEELSVTSRYKELVLCEQDDGSWKTDHVDARYARRRALSKSEVNDIAARTAKIAETIDSDVQIMWFVDIPKAMALAHNLPWYKVTPEQNLDEHRSTSLHARRIRHLDDLKALEGITPGSVKLILEPVGEDLRSDSFIDTVASTCTRLHLPVELRGSILGHAYHQLRKAGVEVFSAEPRKRLQGVRQRKVFQKLVRDDIPDVIRRGGESVSSNELVPNDIKIALVGKLIEEAEELLTASTPDAAKEELADMLEVLRGLAHSLNVLPEAVFEAANKKREKRGGFERGIVLRSTEYKIAEAVSQELFDPDGGGQSKIALSDLSEKVRGNSVSSIPISKLLGLPNGREFKLETRDLGPISVRVTIRGGSISVSVESDQKPDHQSDLF